MKFTIEVDMQDRWVPHFIGMLNTMQSYGSMGCSRNLCFHSDGDGDFRPKFKYHRHLGPEGQFNEGMPEEAPARESSNGNCFYDAG